MYYVMQLSFYKLPKHLGPKRKPFETVEGSSDCLGDAAKQLKKNEPAAW